MPCHVFFPRHMSRYQMNAFFIKPLIFHSFKAITDKLPALGEKLQLRTRTVTATLTVTRDSEYDNENDSDSDSDSNLQQQ